jgi:hypothetical protein
MSKIVVFDLVLDLDLSFLFRKRFGYILHAFIDRK